MKISNYLHKLSLSITLALLGTTALLSGLSSPVAAQINSEATGEPQKNEQSSMGGGTLGSDFNPMNLIHNANLRRSRGGEEFRQDTENELNQAAEKFKRLQQQRLQEAQSVDNVTPQN